MRHLQRRQQSTFTWGLNDITDTNLPECGTISLFLNTTQLSGQQPPAAPYSLIAYPVQGLPSAYPLSLTGVTAPWTVNYPAGTRLVLDIADASGNSGGIPPQIYTVQSGQSNACLPSTSTPVITMKIDEPSALKTCTVLPIHIDGGQKPYTVTLAVTNSVAPSNRTLGSDHDTFELVNQSTPGSTLILAVSDSKGQYAIASKLFTTSGSADASCPGQSSRSYNSNNPNGGSNNSTDSNNNNNNSNGQGSGNNNSDNRNNNQNTQIPLAAIIGAAVGGMVLLCLLLFFCFRRKKDRKGGVGLLERTHYRRPDLDHSPDGSQARLAHRNTGERLHQNHVQPRPYVPPDARSSAALSYYGDSSTTPTPNTSSRYLLPSSVLAATNHQQGPEDRRQSQGYGWQPGFAYPPPSPTMNPNAYPPPPLMTNPNAYPPPSPMAPPNYPLYNNQGTVTSTGQQIFYDAEITTATHLRPQRTSTAQGTSVYSDNASRYSRYTVQSAAPSHGSERSTSGQGAVVSTVAEARQDKGRPLSDAPSQPTDGAPLVYQHEDAKDVVELPPAYREWSAT